MKNSCALSHIISDEFKLVLNLLEFIQRFVAFQTYRCKMQGSGLHFRPKKFELDPLQFGCS